MMHGMGKPDPRLGQAIGCLVITSLVTCSVLALVMLALGTLADILIHL